MQPRNLPAVDAELELPLGFDDDELLGADVLLPHAAASRPATVSAALAARVFFTGYLLFRGAPYCRLLHCRLLRGQSPPPGPNHDAGRDRPARSAFVCLPHPAHEL
jgi:hypothetical protein